MRNTVLQIVPHLPGTFDGVGDSALNLAKALSAGPGITTTFRVAGKTSVESRDGYNVLSSLPRDSSGELAQEFEQVILHCVNCGYQARGLPFALVPVARELRQNCPGHFKPGGHSTINQGCRLDNRGGLEIGSNVSISANVCLLTADLDPQSATFAGRTRPVRIGDCVFVGMRAIILPWGHHCPRRRRRGGQDACATADAGAPGFAR